MTREIDPDAVLLRRDVAIEVLRANVASLIVDLQTLSDDELREEIESRGLEEAYVSTHRLRGVLESLDSLAALAKAMPPKPADPKPKPSYTVRPIKPGKRSRRTKAEMQDVRDGLFQILATGEKPMTIRQLFYRAVVAGIVAKSEYDGTVVRLLTDMRREGRVPYEWIADATRWMRKPQTWESHEAFLKHSAATYRKSLWDDQDAQVEIWCESGSLAGVIIEVTREWDVPLMPCNGQPSLSFLHSCGTDIADETRPVFVYYVGDFDGAGVDITAKVERGIRTFAPDVDLHFERIAVTTEQIEEWNLPTRPPNDADVKRGWTSCVEAEAIEPATLRELVRSSITKHIDPIAYRNAMREQEMSRDVLASMARNGLPILRARKPGAA